MSRTHEREPFVSQLPDPVSRRIHRAMSRKHILILLVCVGVPTILVFTVWWADPGLSLLRRSRLADTTPVDLFTLKANGRLLRYDPVRDPRNSPEAAREYYLRRKEMIIKFRGDHLAFNTLRVLSQGKATRSDLLMALGDVRRYELVEGLTQVTDLLSHPDPVIVHAAAELLCWFGDKRGFDFVMNKIQEPNSHTWWSMFEKDFANPMPPEHLPQLKALLSTKAAGSVETYLAAQVLAKLGDAGSVKRLLPVIEREPCLSIETILKLKKLYDPEVTGLMLKLSNGEGEGCVNRAADVVLANQGDKAAQQRLVKAAQKVIGLPQPQNTDGSYKRDTRAKFVGDSTPAWDEDAVFALEHGMEVVDPAQAVPVLRDIAMHAANVRFSRTAITLLAKIGDESSRSALWDVARSFQSVDRPFEDTLYTTTGMALALFGDETSASLATGMFSGYRYGMEASQFFAETRGWDGLFKLDLSY